MFKFGLFISNAERFKEMQSFCDHISLRFEGFYVIFMCTTYILYSTKISKYYIGHTCDDVDERLKKHLTDHDGFTSRAKDWIIVRTEIFNDKSSAHKRELEIKGWKSRKMIERLILAG